MKKRIRFFCGDSRLPYVNFFIYYRGFPRLLPDMRAETEALKKFSFSKSDLQAAKEKAKALGKPSAVKDIISLIK